MEYIKFETVPFTTDMNKERNERRERMEIWANANNLKESKGRCCPTRLLVGKQCRALTRKLNSDKCACLDLEGLLKDHESLWLKDGRPHVYVIQPYSYDEIKEDILKNWCEKHGLAYEVRPPEEAWYFPAQNRPFVFLILITAK